jgi:glycosyltransferase involved in cell wall biosynthesis
VSVVLRPRVAHFREEFLQLSETFVFDLVSDTRYQRPVAVYRQRLNERLFPLPEANVWTSRDFRQPGDVEDLAAELEEVGIDVVHAHFGYDLPLAAATAFAIRRPLVVSFHGKDASLLLRQFRWRGFYREFLPLADAVVVPYAGLAERLLGLGAPADALQVIETGIRRQAWPPGRRTVSSSGLRLLAVGRLVEKKGLHLLIHALGRAVRAGLDASLTVVGEGPELRLLRELVVAYNLRSRVRFTGSLDRAQIAGLMAAADAMVLASTTSAGGDEETTPVVLKEAMAAGLPILTTDHAGIPGMVEDGVSGVIVRQGSIDELCRGLLRLEGLRGRWREMGRSGRRTVLRTYDQERTLRSWGRLYRRLAGRRPRGLERPA